MTYESKKIAIIIVNYHQIDFTIGCIESVIESDYSNFSIIIIDNDASENDNQLLLSKLPTDYRIQVLRTGENIGYINGVNMGLKSIKNTETDYVVIMNNDTVISTNTLSQLVESMKKIHDQGLISAAVYDFTDKGKFQYLGAKYISKKKLELKKFGVDEVDKCQYSGLLEFDLIDDVMWIFPVVLLDKIGGYNNYFWFNGEQADFALKAKREGYKLYTDIDAKIWHKGSQSIGGRSNNPILSFWSTQSRFMLKYLHCDKITFWRIFILTGLRNFLLYLYKCIARKNSNQYRHTSLKASVLAWKYVFKWIFIKNENIGYNPFL